MEYLYNGLQQINWQQIFKRKFLGLLLLLLINLLFNIQLIHAGQEFIYKPHSKIKARISQSKANRIEFGKLAIRQIIGDESQYQIITDLLSHTIFLIPKGKVGEVIELSLINNAGTVVDLQLIPDEKLEGQVISIVTSQDNISQRTSSSTLKPEEQEIAQMLRSMLVDRKDKYYVVPVKRSIRGLEDIGLKIQQDRLYRYGDLMGARLQITNLRSKESLELQEADFSKLFERTIATYIDHKILPAKGKALVLIIARERAND